MTPRLRRYLLSTSSYGAIAWVQFIAAVQEISAALDTESGRRAAEELLGAAAI